MGIGAFSSILRGLTLAPSKKRHLVSPTSTPEGAQRQPLDIADAVSVFPLAKRDCYFFNTIFSDKRFSILWLAVRVWLGVQWIKSGFPKLTNPAWMQTGEALKGFWTGAIQVPAEGRPPIAFDWYRSFLQFMLDAVSEVMFGVLLIAGIFVGLTAFFSGLMNWNFIMAGSASVNGVLFSLAVLLVLS